MVSQEQNDALTKTGPGTIMGDALPPLLDPGAARLGAARSPTARRCA